MPRTDVSARSFAGVFLVVAGLAFFGPCSSSREAPESEPGAVSGTGVLHSIQVEGGCWELRTGEEDYEVLNLGDFPPELRRDGLRVRFEGRVRDDLATTCQLGTNLELTALERAE